MQDLLLSVSGSRDDLANLSRAPMSPLLPLDAHEWVPNSSESNSSGISVFYTMLFNIFKVPIFSPGGQDFDNLRFLIVHWLKARALPTFVR